MKPLPDLEKFIRLDCCDKHYLHPTKPKVWSAYVRRYIDGKVDPRNNVFSYQLHYRVDYFGMEKIKRLQREHRDLNINLTRPTVEVLE